MLVSLEFCRASILQGVENEYRHTLCVLETAEAGDTHYPKAHSHSNSGKESL